MNTFPLSYHSNLRVRREFRKKSGFSLVEVLVVMAIIATLLGIGVGTIKSLSKSKGVSTAVPLADGVFEQARLVAKSSGAPTRVVIYAADTAADKSEKRERHLRMMGVVTGRVGSGTSERPARKGEPVGTWRMVSRPITLPDNTFFNASLSGMTTPQGAALFPGSNTPKSCYVYEFNSEGYMIAPTNDGGGTATDGQFVVQAGKLRPGEDKPDTDRSAKRDVGGFKIWENGRKAHFRSPNQIVDAADEPEF